MKQKDFKCENCSSDLFYVENGREECIHVKCLGCGSRIFTELDRDPSGICRKKQGEML